MKTASHPRLDSVTAEQQSPLWLGLLVHLGPAAGFITYLSFAGVTLFNVLSAFVTVALLNLLVVLYIEGRSPSVELPTPGHRETLQGLALVFVTGFLCGGSFVALGWWGLSHVVPAAGAHSWLPVVAAVMLTDLVYYWSHRALNHGKGRNPIVRWFRKNHVMHHSVPHLDFMRGNVSSFFDTALTGFQLPLVAFAAAFGLSLEETLAAYGLVVMLQATHHVNHTFNIGALRFFFMDNHAHKLHHCPRGRLVNHGALFSVWDQLFGTFYENWSLSSNQMAKERVAIPVVESGTCPLTGLTIAQKG